MHVSQPEFPLCGAKATRIGRSPYTGMIMRVRVQLGYYCYARASLNHRHKLGHDTDSCSAEVCAALWERMTPYTQQFFTPSDIIRRQSLSPWPLLLNKTHSPQSSQFTIIMVQASINAKQLRRFKPWLPHKQFCFFLTLGPGLFCWETLP